MATRTFRGTTNSNWNLAANWAEGAVPLSADDVVFDVSSPNCTVNVAGTCLSITFATYTNTITMTFGINVATNITLGASMSFVGTNGFSIIGSSSTITSNGKIVPAITFAATQTVTLADDLTIGTLMNITGTPTINTNGGGTSKININGNLTHSSTISVTGTATINFNVPVSGTWSHTGSGIIRNNITINCAGTLTIGNVAWFGSTLTYTAGSVNCTGTLTMNATAATTLNCSGMSGSNAWNNIQMTGATTFTTNDLYIDGLLTLAFSTNTIVLAATSGTKTIYCNGGYNTTLTSGSVTSTTVNIKITGGNITAGGSAVNQGQISVPLFEFSPSTSNITLSSTGILHLSSSSTGGTNIVKYTPSTYSVITTGSTIRFNTMTIDTDGITWGNLIVYQQAAANSTTLTSDLSCNGLLNMGFGAIVCTYNGSGRTINSAGGFTFTSGVTSGIVTGNISGLRVTGGNITGLSSAQLRLNITLDGNVTFVGGLFYNTGTITYTSGTITTTGSTLTSNTVLTMNTNGMTWNNITFSASNLGLTLLSNFQMSGLLNTSGSFTFTGNFDVTLGSITTTINGTTITLVSGRTYNVTGAIIFTGSLTLPITLRSSTPGSVTYFNSVNNGTSTRDIGFVTATDINSSGGLTIYDYKGTFNNTTNWSLLTEPRTLSYGYSI